jgi:glutamate--cysteine ligase
LAREWAEQILSKIEVFSEKFGFSKFDDYNNAISKVRDLFNNPEKHPTFRLKKQIEEKGYLEFHLELARKYKKESLIKGFRFHGFEDMELSTQLILREAVYRGVEIEIIDRHENFIVLKKDDKKEYVMQATRTTLDNYSSIMIMENKLVTKKILAKNNINVPAGCHYLDINIAKSDFLHFMGRPIVIKPKSTNFGLGITILKTNDDKAVFQRAVEIAFEQDTSILIEEFIEGKEFRVFIINGEVTGILHRIPANVTGDGKKSIHELVSDKNKSPLRGRGYRTPLEKINLAETEKMFLASQNLTFESIAAKDETVYLRENSNISTGGDSIDYTDIIHHSYKEIALKATSVLNVKITGLDIIIPEPKKPAANNNYAIIEMNFNPAIHIHCYPFIGKNRRLDKKILDALGF